MPPLLVTGGAYQADDVIANAQRCVNLYPETTPKESRPPVPVTHYQRPGKTLLGAPISPAAGRGLYVASNGDLFAVVGSTVYFVTAAWAFIALGTITTSVGPVSMADNGQDAGNDLVLVDGSVNGYEINMTTKVMSTIVDGTGLFQGANVVQYLQTFFLFNVRDTNQWITSLSNSVSFNALDIAAKSSYPDPISNIGIRQREVWLIGTQTTEPWYLAGGADFAFGAMPSTFVPHGCLARFSVAFADIALFWLARNAQGDAIVVKSDNYAVKRISNHAIESMIQSLSDISDAVGQVYQVKGHTFYVLNFPTGDLTLAFDMATEQWHQLAWTDENGILHRDRALFYANAHGKIVGQDWETGYLYHIDPETYTDEGDPITFIRGWPHVLGEMKRMTHWNVVVDIDPGNIQDPTVDPQLNLRYSDTRGHSWSNWIATSMGSTGQYDKSPQFTNLGMARDRVYELMWSLNAKTALNGLYIEVEPSES